MYTSIPTELGLEAIEYWIMRKRDLISQRFIKEFILESIEFILKQLFFDSKLFNQIFGTAMSSNCAPPYRCLTIGYQEETKLCRQELPKHFFSEECLSIKEFFKKYMDDGLIFWSKHLGFNSFPI